MDILSEFSSRFSSKANNFLRLLPYALSLYWSNDRSLGLFLDSDRQRQNRRRGKKHIVSCFSLSADYLITEILHLPSKILYIKMNSMIYFSLLSSN